MPDEIQPRPRRRKRTAPRLRQRAPAREHAIKVRLSGAEYERLKAVAAAAGKAPAVFLREHVDEVRVRHREDEHQRNVLLNRWNGNLNMIAKWVNTYRDEADVRHVIRQLKALERELSLVRQLWSQS
jgi:DNA-binding FrmR family transcriptional regulator